MVEACYDLSRYPANFNFIEFLVAARTMGATRISFDTSSVRPKFTPYETQKRIASILIPACELAGCDYTFDKGSKYIDPGYHMDVLIKTFHAYGKLEKLKSVLPPGNERYTVTLRNSSRYPQRNSGDDWRRFAKEIGAFVIEDYGDEPIDLRKRMALYAGAEMNYFVANGPMMLCVCSDYPFTAFMKNVDEKYHAEHGFPVGSQLPWLTDKQRFVWLPDTYENLRAHALEGQAEAHS